MRKFILGAVIALIGLSSSTMAQADYSKKEFFAGYSHSRVDLFTEPFINGNIHNFSLDKHQPFNGFEVSGVYNVRRYFGIKADVSGAYHKKRYRQPVSATDSSLTADFKANNSLYNFLGGIQIKDNATKTRVKPFAHVLVGAGFGRTKISDDHCPSGAFCASLNNASMHKVGFAGVAGGGLDIKVNDRIDIRAIQVDYNLVRFHGYVTHNVRFGFGIVIK